jgi:hypothetical protein
MSICGRCLNYCGDSNQEGKDIAKGNDAAARRASPVESCVVEHVIFLTVFNLSKYIKTEAM